MTEPAHSVRITRVQRHMLMSRVWRRLKAERKNAPDEVDRMMVIWENMLGWGMADKTIDLRKLGELEILLLLTEIDEMLDRAPERTRRRLRRTYRSIAKTQRKIIEFNERSAVDRLADIGRKT